MIHDGDKLYSDLVISYIYDISEFFCKYVKYFILHFLTFNLLGIYKFLYKYLVKKYPLFYFMMRIFLFFGLIFILYVRSRLYCFLFIFNHSEIHECSIEFAVNINFTHDVIIHGYKSQ